MALSIIVIAVLIGLMPASIASKKGHGFAGWWIFGALLFIVALPMAIVLKPNEAGLNASERAQGRRQCPFCAEFIRSEANVCRFCGRDVEQPTPAVIPADHPYAYLRSQHPQSFDVVWEQAQDIEPWPKFPIPALLDACIAVERGTSAPEAVRTSFSSFVAKHGWGLKKTNLM